MKLIEPIVGSWELINVQDLSSTPPTLYPAYPDSSKSLLNIYSDLTFDYRDSLGNILSKGNIKANKKYPEEIYISSNKKDGTYYYFLSSKNNINVTYLAISNGTNGPAINNNLYFDGNYSNHEVYYFIKR